MKETDKRPLREKLANICLDEFELTLDDLINNLKEYKRKFKNYDEVFLEIDIEYDLGDEYKLYTLYGNRLETDKEVEKRVKRTKAERAKKKKEKKLREEKEYTNYLKLKDKYENKKRVRVK